MASYQQLSLRKTVLRGRIRWGSKMAHWIREVQKQRTGSWNGLMGGSVCHVPEVVANIRSGLFGLLLSVCRANSLDLLLWCMVHGRVPWLKGPDVELMVPGCLKYFDQVKLAWLECCEINHLLQGIAKIF